LGHALLQLGYFLEQVLFLASEVEEGFAFARVERFVGFFLF
jgi:hypothetical protein